jgi:hypothetical protein
MRNMLKKSVIWSQELNRQKMKNRLTNMMTRMIKRCMGECKYEIRLSGRRACKSDRGAWWGGEFGQEDGHKGKKPDAKSLGRGQGPATMTGHVKVKSLNREIQ